MQVNMRPEYNESKKKKKKKDPKGLVQSLEKYREKGKNNATVLYLYSTLGRPK